MANSVRPQSYTKSQNVNFVEAEKRIAMTKGQEGVVYRVGWDTGKWVLCCNLLQQEALVCHCTKDDHRK